MNRFSIAGREVGEGAPVLVIAELSANHGGQLGNALKTIEVAAKMGADAIKLQTYTPDTLTLKSDAPPFVVRTKNVWEGRTLYDLYREAMTPWEWHAELLACAKANGLLCFSTPFDPTATEFLRQLRVPAYKIASFEIGDLPLIEHTARHGLPMLISTGMASLAEIEAAVDVCRSVGNHQLALLRCVSSYPANPEDMHLQSLRTLQDLGVVVGLSDHTRDDTVAIAAVATGAKIVEKHFILDRSIGGPDAFFSLDPEELRRLIKAVRLTEAAMQPPRFGPSQNEQASMFFRRSLFVTQAVGAGEVLTCDAIRSIRPSSGLPVRHLRDVLGRTAARPLAAGEPLLWESVATRPVRPEVMLRVPSLRDAEGASTDKRVPEPLSAPDPSNGSVLPDARAAKGRFVAESDGHAVGEISLNETPVEGIWAISIALVPGLDVELWGPAVLAATETLAADSGARTLTARIPAENAAALRAFKLAGFYGFVPRVSPAGRVQLCERRVVPF